MDARWVVYEMIEEKKIVECLRTLNDYLGLFLLRDNARVFGVIFLMF